MTQGTFAALIIGIACALGSKPGTASEPSPLCNDDGWRMVLPGKAGAISGIVRLPLAERAWLVVHDVKAGAEESRLHRVDVSANGTLTATPVAWPGDLKDVNDLEALATIPSRDHEFLAVQSNGKIFHIEFDKPFQTASIVATVQIPEPPKEIEGFSVAMAQSGYVAAWAGRGELSASGDEVLPADLRLGTLSFADKALTSVNETSKAQVTAPWPPSKKMAKSKVVMFTRHVSDLALRSDGRLFAVSAFDPGDDGPFVSSLYEVGTVDLSKSRPELTPGSASETSRRFARKCEAATVVGDCFTFASDDENEGGWILVP